MPDYVVLISIAEPYAASLSQERLTEIARRVLEAEAAPPSELSIAITDDDTMRALNHEYAGEDAVTDVLSFSQREGEEFAAPPGGVPPLGEVIVAYPQARRQAQGRLSRQTGEQASGGRGTRDAGEGGALRRAQGERTWGVAQEIEWLLVHGILHLLGYDHVEPEEVRRMRAREEELLG